jgi:multisubunit Na+/H+ antiporter MnhG subunit
VSFFFIVFAIFSTFLMLAAALAFLRAKDVFVMTHVVMIANCYIVPLILLVIALENLSVASSIKVVGLILLNLVVANLLCYLVARRAMTNKITPDARLKN